MMITVCAPKELLEELGDKDFQICSREEAGKVNSGVLFYLYDDGYFRNFDPSAFIVINEVSRTLELLNHHSIARINGWKGFLARDTWEIAGVVQDEVIRAIESLGKKYILCKDKPGFISARIVAMIINEAYFALEEDVSTEKDIDIAMKLGTGYPFGPFEWGRLIGIGNICNLLIQLSQADPIYSVCPLLALRVTL